MDKFTFLLGNATIDCAVGTYKYLMNESSCRSHDLYRTLAQTFDKVDNSEYSITRNASRKLLINDEPINLKRYSLAIVSPHFDLGDAIKLKTNSIFHHYFNALFKDIEYTDTFNTLSILFADLETEICEMMDFDDDDLRPSVSVKALTPRTLLKFIDMTIEYDEEELNTFDLNYEEIILFQLKTISKLAKLEPKKTWIVYGFIPKVTKNIHELITYYLPENIRILLDGIPYFIHDIEEVLWLREPSIDFADELAVYDQLTLTNEHCTTIDDTKAYYLSRFQHNRTVKTSKERAFQ